MAVRAPASHQDARVLIVEDEAPLRRMLCRWVQERYACTAVESAEAARRIIARGDFDLLLCDIGLPGESGLHLAGTLIAQNPEIAVVMVTGQDAPEVWHAALEQGVYGYLLKPVDRLQLIIGIENALRRRHLERQERRYVQRLKRLVSTLRRVNQELRCAHQRELAQQQELVAKERLQARFELAGTMAHDMNQPLMILLGYLEMMSLDAHDPEKVAAHVKKATAAGWRIAEIVKRVRLVHQERPFIGR